MLKLQVERFSIVITTPCTVLAASISQAKHFK